jgi:succinate dehydrogenase / fumarate reductase cytochrome b subunit
MLALAFHLWHGFASAFQTLGLNHVKYNPVIRFVGRTFAIVVPALFALIPVWMFLT